MTTKELDKEFSRQVFDNSSQSMLEHCKELAAMYAETENVIAVLSDLKEKHSYLCFGGIVSTLAVDRRKLPSQINSIWENEVFSIIHPDDLQRKHIEELQFFHFISKQPSLKRQHYYLASPLRMKTSSGSYIEVLHRIYYFESKASDSVRMALCLYGMPTQHLDKAIVVDTVTGELTSLEESGESLLSKRELDVLRLVAQGAKSIQIADALCISVHTVSRHRQNIIEKLQVSNSTDACTLAKKMQLI